MKKFGFATIGTAAVGGVAAAIIGLAAPALAAPSGPDNAQQTIGQLKSQGYTVIVNRLGNAPLDQAEVVAVRPGQTYTHLDAGAPIIGGNDNYTTVRDRVVYVDVR
ncbi:hypothetical protein [Mycobacterium deserti]|uniref:DUF1236 domain-containing protein n=1 Tax=Mycobacterium deserti TaxID=2978347 RepID=A0ABT2MJ50_9MYCO|nr:hypothetical protein [Mycobacterium deserti]MCT7662021.1 hypothetical protein [Mycobacterium deserti]